MTLGKPKHPAARALIACLCLYATPRAAADSGAPSGHAATFGSVRQARGEAPIHWESSHEVELTAEAARFTRPGSTLRSELLPLTPLQHYRISTTISRGPGATPRFAISYVDTEGQTIEWQPAWQHPKGPHADWLPLSAHAQRYVQGFVLPLGASQPRLVLRLEASASADKAFAPYSHWTLRHLTIDALGNVTCCERLGSNLLWNGDFEDASNDGQPKQWSQWGATPDNRVELIALPDEPARKHVVRIKPGTSAHLFSRYFAPVSSGSAYRLSLLVRGQGRIQLDAHSLTRDRPIPLRVGNHLEGTRPIEVHTHTWQELSTVWIAEAPRVMQAHVVVSIWAHSAIEIDAIELRPFE